MCTWWAESTAMVEKILSALSPIFVVVLNAPCQARWDDHVVPASVETETHALVGVGCRRRRVVLRVHVDPRAIRGAGVIIREDVLRRPGVPAVEAAVDARVQLGRTSADLPVVQGPRVAHGVRHVAGGTSVGS